MTNDVGLWVCPNCGILQGIEIAIHDDQFLCKCVACGVPIDIEDVHFVNPDKVRKVSDYVQQYLPEDLYSYVRYSWVSNRTVGLIFELERYEVSEFIGVEDPIDFFEDQMGDDLDLTVTVYFE